LPLLGHGRGEAMGGRPGTDAAPVRTPDSGE
jgi:hypothetical protein